MPLFLCRWPNGDSSVVLAPTRDDALIELDQVGNAEGCPLAEVRTFQIHFALTDQGGLVLESFGEGTKEELLAFAHPVLESALDEACGDDGHTDFESLPPDRQAAIARRTDSCRQVVTPSFTKPRPPGRRCMRDKSASSDSTGQVTSRRKNCHRDRPPVAGDEQVQSTFLGM